MDSKRMEEFRLLLLKKRDGILKTSRHNLEAANELGKDGVTDIADQGSITYDRMLLNALSEAEKKNVVEIDDALDRIKKGKYGICQKCEGPVGDKRLEVRPEALQCVKCQSDAEGRR